MRSAVSHAGPLVGSSPSDFMQSLDISSLTEEQADFITSVLLFEVVIRQKALSSTEVRREFSDMFSPASLLSAGHLLIPSDHRNVRDFLDSNGPI